MQKAILLGTFSLLSLGAAAQAPAGAKTATSDAATALPVDPETKRITYSAVVEMPGLSQDQLYTRAFEWVAQTYNSAQKVVQMQDKAAGQLVVKPQMKVKMRGYTGPTYVHYTLSIYVKDGRYKYVLTDLRHEVPAGEQYVYSGGPLETPEPKLMLMGPNKKAWDEIRQQAASEAQLLTANLTATMNKKATSDF